MTTGGQVRVFLRDASFAKAILLDRALDVLIDGAASSNSSEAKGEGGR